jgi:excinuclease ABC subunit C
MAAKTAAAGFRDSVRSMEERERVLERLAGRLGLGTVPRIMECYDISNLGGSSATGSLVTFEDGFPMKSRYRRFRIRRGGGPDDPGMMREMVLRRFRRALRERQFLPNLVVLDGGKAQLGVAREVLAELGIQGVETVALAKGRSRRRKGEVRPGLGERVFTGTPPIEIELEEGSAEWRILRHVRDEAHRFALRYHRQLRRKKWIESPWEGLVGLGEKRRRALLQAFGSHEGIRRAGVEELRAVPGITASLAREIHASFEREEDLGGGSIPDDEDQARG